MNTATRAVRQPIRPPATPPTGGATATGGARAGAAAAVVSLFLLGTSAPVAARVEDVPMLLGQGLRFALTAVVLLALVALRGDRLCPRLRDVGRAALLSLVGVAGFTVCLVGATRYADPALVGSVLAATPVLLAVAGPLSRRRRPAGSVVVGSVLVAAGTALATGAGSASAVGLLLCASAVICEVAFTLLAVDLIASNGALTTAAYAFTGAATVLLAAAALHGDLAGRVSIGSSDLLALAYLALGSSAVATVSWYVAVPRLGADRAGVFYAFSPVGALVGGLALGTSHLSVGEFLGLVIVTAGLVVGLRRTRPHGDRVDGRMRP